MPDKTFFQEYEDIIKSTDSIPKIREMILQLAVQGRLVKQDPDDEPASVLLEKIKAEKEKLIKEGKIKKQKPLPDIKPEEVPYELPEGWEWVRLDNLLLKLNDGTHHSPPNGETGAYKYITAKNIKSDGIDLKKISYVTAEIHKSIYSRCNPEFGDILYIKDGATTGIVAINNLKEEFSLLSSVGLLKVPKSLYNKYLLYALKSPFFYDYIRSDMAGAAITRVTIRKMKKAIVPIPPLPEQHRIVARIEQLMAICDQLEARQKAENEKNLELNNSALHHLLESGSQEEFNEHWNLIQDNFDNLYDKLENVNKLQEAILQLAVQGRLVKQDPNDEPASVLLEKIKAEKEKLIKEGKIKKSKPLPDIKPEEVPYELPEGWEWARLGEIFVLKSGIGVPKGEIKNSGAIPFIKVSDMNIPENINEIMTSNHYLAKYNEKDIIPTGSIIFPKRGGAIKTNKKRLTTHSIIVDPNIMAILENPKIYKKYLYYWFKSFDLWILITGMAVPQINNKDINPILFPIPPFEEQNRIVARVEELMALTNKLKEHVEKAGNLRKELLGASVGEVLGVLNQ